MSDSISALTTRIRAFTDEWATWLHAATIKLGIGDDPELIFAMGADEGREPAPPSPARVRCGQRGLIKIEAEDRADTVPPCGREKGIDAFEVLGRRRAVGLQQAVPFEGRRELDECADRVGVERCGERHVLFPNLARRLCPHASPWRLAGEVIHAANR